MCRDGRSWETIMRATALAVVFLAVGACQQDDQTSQQAQAQTPSVGGREVEQGPPNRRNTTPAFPQQTRAPESRSNVTLKVETIADGINHPWGTAVLPEDGALLVTSRAGKLWLIEPGKPKKEVAGAPQVDARGQGGLLDISLGPDFLANRSVYMSFSEPRGNAKNSTSLAKGKLSADRSRLENVQVIFRQEPPWASTMHFGSNIEWDSAGSLFLTVGERSLPEPRQLAQKLSTDLGKVLHLKADGTPAD